MSTAVPERWTITQATAALARLPAGATVAVGGLTLYRRPVALCRALLSCGVRDLRLAGLTLSIESEPLVAAGRVRAVRTSYYGLEIFGLAPAFSRAAESGALEVIDESERSFCEAIASDLIPDIALVHMPFADKEGNAYGLGSPAVDPELARAARTTLVSFEHTGIPEPHPALWKIPACDIDVLVPIPGGAQPTSCAPLYPLDGLAILRHVAQP